MQSGSYTHTFNMLDPASYNVTFLNANGGTPNGAEAALAACINPPKTNFLFYFTDRQGTTHFETNEQDFERDKVQYGVSGS